MQKNADAFRTISEVAEELALPQHVLRFWETRFPQIRPLKRAGGRRYYRPGDITLLKSIRALLYEEGYTIKGVQRLLKEQGPKGVSASAPTDREPEMLAADIGDAPAESLEESPSAVAPSDATASRPEEDGAAASWTRADPGLGFDPFSAAPGHLSRDQADAGPRFGTAHADVGPLGPLQRDALETVLLVLEDCDRILAPLRRRTA